MTYGTDYEGEAEDEMMAKEALVKQLNEDVIIVLKRHEVVRLIQIVAERLNSSCFSQVEYEHSIWKKLVNEEPNQGMVELKEWLLGRENDIAIGDADLGELRVVFKAVLGREAKVE